MEENRKIGKKGRKADKKAEEKGSWGKAGKERRPVKRQRRRKAGGKAGKLKVRKRRRKFLDDLSIITIGVANKTLIQYREGKIKFSLSAIPKKPKPVFINPNRYTTLSNELSYSYNVRRGF